MNEWREGDIGKKGIRERRYERNDSLLKFSSPCLQVYIQNCKVNFKY
jgi:hypothetical protein